MNKKEIILTVYGLFLISYFSLSLMAFMASPLSASLFFIDGFSLILGLVVGFIVYSIWFIRQQHKETIKP